MALPKIVSRDEWSTARKELLAKEKKVTRARDAVNAERRTLPIVRIEKDYAFDGPAGRVGLLDLFAERQQLIVYHFWFEPGEEPCEGCSLWLNNLGHMPGLYDRDTAFAVVSRAPSVEIETVKERNGWTVPWFSLVGDDFSDDAGYTGEPQITVFVRDEREVFCAYATSGRILRTVSSHWTLLELTPLGAP